MIKILLLLTVLLLNCSEEEKTEYYNFANVKSPILHSIKVTKEKDKTICKYILKAERSTNSIIFQIEEIVFYCDKPDFDLIGKKVKLKFEEDK